MKAANLNMIIPAWLPYYWVKLNAAIEKAKFVNFMVEIKKNPTILDKVEIIYGLK